MLHLKYFLWQKPNRSLKRLAIINEAENLTSEAQNAALKIVEEPPESSLIIFIAKTSEDLFSTLTSRLQKIYFSSGARINPHTKNFGVGVNADSKADKRRYIKENLRKSESVLSEFTFSEAEIDEFFEDLIRDLSIDRIKNSGKLKEILHRLALMKQFNTNKKLQLRALE